MADPVNYCNWLYPSFCISQSEWAAWTQAVLTVLTFAVALWRQERTHRQAEAKKDASDELLKMEKENSQKAKRRAIAIVMNSELAKFGSLATAILMRGLTENPKQMFEIASPLLDLRRRGFEAAELGDAADAVLKAVEGAEKLHIYFDSRSELPHFTEDDATRVKDLCEVLVDISEAAEEGIGHILYPHRMIKNKGEAHAASP